MALAATWWAAPTGGEAPELPPDQLSPTQARVLRNFLVHHPGRIVPRGNFGNSGLLASETGSLLDTTNGGALLGTDVFEDTITASYRAPEMTKLVDYWRVPINRPTGGAQLSQPSLGATAKRRVATDTGTVTDISTSDALKIPGPSFCRVGGARYAATYGGTSTTTVNGGVAPLNCVHKTDYDSIDVSLTNGPRFVQAVFEHYGRVWAAAARTPGGSDYDTSNIWYTIPGGTTTNTDVVTDWQDPVTGEFNRFGIGAANDGDFVVGFGRAAGHLLVFKRNSVWVLYGTAPSNFTLRQLRAQNGCIDFRSIAVADEGTYFASQRGYELFDGTNFKLLTEPIAETWIAFMVAYITSVDVNHGFIRASLMPNGYLHLALGEDPIAANGGDGTQFSWMLHRASGALIQLRTSMPHLGLVARCPNRFVMTRSRCIAFGGGGKWAAADFLAYGPTADGAVDKASGVSTDVDLLWTTSVDNMGSYREFDGRWVTNTLARATLDYRHYYVNAAPEELTPFATLRADDGFGDALVPELDVPGYVTPGPLRVRQVFDTTQESSRGDITLTFQSKSGATAPARLDIYGVGVQFQHGRQRRKA